MRKKESYPFPEVICPICGKTFIPGVGHVYKDKRTYQSGKRVCSYKCMRESERMKEAAKKAKAKKG